MSESRFLRAAAVVADFGSPFYGEERQRDVWNEASALGFQTQLWLAYLVATAAIWIGGWTAFPYCVAIMCAAGLASVLTVTYAERLGVRVNLGLWRQAKGRAGLLLGLMVLLLVGLLRAYHQHDPSNGGIAGLIAGMVTGFLAVVAVLVYRQRKASRAEVADDAAGMAPSNR